MDFSGKPILDQIRQHDRAALDLYVNKIVGDEPHLVRVRDISVSGIYLYKLLEPNVEDAERVGLELKLPNHDEVIWAVGEVVREEKRARADGVAVRFVRITETDRETIRQYVQARRQTDNQSENQAV